MRECQLVQWGPYTFNFWGTTWVRLPPFQQNKSCGILHQNVLGLRYGVGLGYLIIICFCRWVRRVFLCSAFCWCTFKLGSSNSYHWQAYHESCRRTFVSYQAGQHLSPLVIHALRRLSMSYTYIWVKSPGVLPCSLSNYGVFSGEYPGTSLVTVAKGISCACRRHSKQGRNL
jgi:hypothetical protein